MQGIGLLTSWLVAATSTGKAEIPDFLKTDLKEEEAEELPKPAAQTGPEARNYVAYIPVPINDDDEDDEYYYDDDDEYYDEDDEYYYDDEDEPPPKKKKKPYRGDRRQSSSNRRRFDDYEEESQERVPFLVPLMMVPENQVGLQKEFSFSNDPQQENNFNNPNEIQKNIINRIVDPAGYNRKFPPRPAAPRPGPPRRPPGPRLGRPVHDIPGPPYRGPPPRNPALPLDNTIIHPSVQRMR